MGRVHGTQDSSRAHPGVGSDAITLAYSRVTPKRRQVEDVASRETHLKRRARVMGVVGVRWLAGRRCCCACEMAQWVDARVEWQPFERLWRMKLKRLLACHVANGMEGDGRSWEVMEGHGKVMEGHGRRSSGEVASHHAIEHTRYACCHSVAAYGRQTCRAMP